MDNNLNSSGITKVQELVAHSPPLCIVISRLVAAIRITLYICVSLYEAIREHDVDLKMNLKIFAILVYMYFRDRF